MSKKFLGLDELGYEGQLRVGLSGAALLALECVIAGLVTDSSVRGWIAHALTFGLAIWAMTDLKPIAVRFAGFAAVIAVSNEALLIAEAQQSMKFLLPGSLLLVVAVWILERSFKETSLRSEDSDSWVGQDIEFELNATEKNSMLTRLWAPLIVLVGVFLTLFGFLEADWVKAKFLFDLLSDTFTYSEIRRLWDDFGAPSLIAKFYVSLSHLLGYFAMLVAAVGAFGGLIQKFDIPKFWRLIGFVTIGAASFMQIVVVFGLLVAKSNIVVQSGAWLAPVGLAIAALGFWFASE